MALPSTDRKLFLGARMKRMRRDLGITQTRMAEDLGVSPSYLNLLERNQRPVTAQVLLRLAEAYDLDLKTLSADPESTSASGLGEVFSDQMFRDLGIARHEVAEVAESAPGVSEAIVRLYRAYLDQHKDGTGQFGCLVAEDDPAIFDALFAAAEAWLKAKGMVRVTGPFTLSINEEVGLLVDGFDSRPILMVPYDPPYAGPRVEACGYMKAKDLFSYDYDVQNAPETIGRKLLDRAGLAGRVGLEGAFGDRQARHQGHAHAGGHHVLDGFQR